MKCITRTGISTVSAERAKPVEDLHGNAARYEQLKARAMNRTSTTAAELALTGGFMPNKAPVSPPDRVDMQDASRSPTALHAAYMAALRGCHGDDE